MRGARRFRVIGPFLGAMAAAELGVRLTTPSADDPRPASVDLRAYFTDEEIERGARFARPQIALMAVRSATQLAVLIALLRRRPSALSSPPGGPVAGAGAAAAAIGAGLTAVQLPLAAVGRRRAIAVGLVTQSWRGWAGDLAKASAIQSAIAAATGASAIAVMRRYERGWWAAAAAGSFLAGTAFSTLAPVVLDPLFNDFTPLPDGETRSDVLELARAAGVKVGEVYSVDASRRTTAANAYVTGLGPTKRVVLYDTLLDRYSRDEIRLVVAHELAHVRNRDIARGLLYGAIVAPAGAFAVQRLSWAMSPDRGTPAAIPALGLATAVVSVPAGVLGGRLSRAVERRADALSLELAGAPEAFISFERRIAVQNVADIDPPRWLAALLASHPPTAERIGAAVAFMQREPVSA